MQPTETPVQTPQAAQAPPQAPAAHPSQARAAAPSSPPIDRAAVAQQLGVPQKFVKDDGTVDVAGMAKSYAAAERELTRRAEGRTPQRPETIDDIARRVAAETTRGSPASASSDPLASPEANSSTPQAAPGAAKTPDELAKELMELGSQDYMANGGKLSQAFYDRAAQAGFSRQTVDSYVSAQVGAWQAEVNQIVNTIYTDAGGKDQFDQAISWARGNLSKDEAAAFDNALRGQDQAARTFAVKGLMSRYRDEFAGRPGTTINTVSYGAGAGTAAGQAPFSSLAEVTKAMASPEYKSSERFREEVKQRLAASHRAGIDLNLRIVANGQRVA